MTIDDPMSDDDSTSDESSVALLFNKCDAGVKAGMAVDSSDDEEASGGIQLYVGAGKKNADNAIEDSMNETAVRRAARERKRRMTNHTINSDDDDEDSFVPKSQTKKGITGGNQQQQNQVVSLLDDDDKVVNLYQDSSDEETPPKLARTTRSGSSFANVLNAETARRLRELKMSSHRMNTGQTMDVDDDVNATTSTTRWIKVVIEGTDKSAAFTMSESNSTKDLVAQCIERFQLDPSSPIALYHGNRVLGNTDLFFDIPVQCEIIAKVHKLTVKEAPKGKIMRLTLRGPSGDAQVEIGELQPLQVALDQYGAGTKLKFDGDVMDLHRRPGFYELEDEDLIDVA